MTLVSTIKKVNDDKIEIYVNDSLLFATVRKVLPAKAKGEYQWTYDLAHLSVETYALYKDAPDAVIQIENYINLLNRA
jgi:hypothetical protein